MARNYSKLEMQTKDYKSAYDIYVISINLNSETPLNVLMDCRECSYL